MERTIMLVIDVDAGNEGNASECSAKCRFFSPKAPDDYWCYLFGASVNGKNRCGECAGKK